MDFNERPTIDKDRFNILYSIFQEDPKKWTKIFKEIMK